MHIHRRCKTPTDSIAVFIMWEGKQLGLCNKCWDKVSSADLEWGDEPKMENFKEWLEKGRGLEGTVLTEYDPTKKGKARYKESVPITQQEDEEVQPYGFEGEEIETEE